MQMIYNSPTTASSNSRRNGHHLMNAGGYEIVDKNAQRKSSSTANLPNDSART